MKYTALADLISVDTESCRECGLCARCCPADIPVPAMVEIYREYRVEGEAAFFELDTGGFTASPIDCIECGACSSVCPGRFDLAGMMRELAMASYI